MITSIQLVNFKNFANETLNLGPFTIIVGASGRHNQRPLDTETQMSPRWLARLWASSCATLTS